MQGWQLSCFFLSTCSLCYVPLQIFYLFLLNCYALRRLSISLPYALLNRSLMLDFHDFASYTLYKSIFAFHWRHVRSASIFHFRNGSNVVLSLSWASLSLTLLGWLSFYHSILAWSTTRLWEDTILLSLCLKHLLHHHHNDVINQERPFSPST